MSVWHLPERRRDKPPAHEFSLQEYAIFAFGALAAVMLGIAASGLLPIV